MGGARRAEADTYKSDEQTQPGARQRGTHTDWVTDERGTRELDKARWPQLPEGARVDVVGTVVEDGRPVAFFETLATSITVFDAHGLSLFAVSGLAGGTRAADATATAKPASGAAAGSVARVAWSVPASRSTLHATGPSSSTGQPPGLSGQASPLQCSGRPVNNSDTGGRDRSGAAAIQIDIVVDRATEHRSPRSGYLDRAGTDSPLVVQCGPDGGLVVMTCDTQRGNQDRDRYRRDNNAASAATAHHILGVDRRLARPASPKSRDGPRRLASASGSDSGGGGAGRHQRTNSARQNAGATRMGLAPLLALRGRAEEQPR